MKQVTLTFIIVALLALNVSAQTPSSLTAVVGQGTSDRPIDGGLSGFEIQAVTDATTATIKASQTRSGASDVFTTLQLIASAPLNKGSDSTTIAAASGFPNAFALTGKYVGYRFKDKTPDLNGLEIKKICDAMRAGARTKGLTEADVKNLICQSETVALYAPQFLDSFDALFFDLSKWQVMWGGSGTVGHRIFEYLNESDLTKSKTTKTPWGASAFLATIPPNLPMLITAGFEYRDKYKDADSGTLCPAQGESAVVRCKTGPVGTPSPDQQQLLFAEVRTLFGVRAVSLKAAYDFKQGTLSGDLPIYLFKSPSGALSGGVRVSWEERKDVQYGVFVSSSFSLFPF